MARRVLSRRGRSLRRIRRWTGVAGLVAVVSVAWASPGHGGLESAGSTAAVFSFVDAAGGAIEVIRHWPGAASSVPVYPFVPYFWDGCPGPGAIMMLVTGPADAPPSPIRIAGALEARMPRDPVAHAEIARIVATLRAPGDPAFEAFKASAPWVSDLATYERWGYAVFLFIYWQGARCVVTFRAVSEGYGIPFVR